jgi:hypothetical protein
VKDLKLSRNPEQVSVVECSTAVAGTRAQPTPRTSAQTRLRCGSCLHLHLSCV